MRNKTYKTARGKTVDMNALLAKNEKTPAVGNMKANARGDIIDHNGKVLVPVTDRISQQYAQTVGNKSAQVQIKPTPPKPELTKEELELEAELNDDFEVEEIKKKNG
jgi:hypothetical protein